MKSIALVTSAATVFFGGINIYKGNEKFYENIIMPISRMLPPETAHMLAVKACKYKLFYGKTLDDLKILETQFFGRSMSNPIGIAAGFDKQGEAVEGLEQIGFGLVEVGSITPLPQPGNPKPRVFRLIEDQAIINRYGFNSDGHEIVYQRLKELKDRKCFKGVLGVNLGKNKTSENGNMDYVKGIEVFGPICDYLVINISSPNTPGLRNLQYKKNLEDLLTDAIKARNNLTSYKPVFLKIAPDLTKEEVKDITKVISKKACKIDGLIISNTTVDRTNLRNELYSQEVGGLSGAPLKLKSTELIAQIYYETSGKIPIIGVGGVFDGKDAYEKILAGASYIQIYTALIYNGPPIVNKIKIELNELLEKNGYRNVNEAVGKNYKKYLR
ncbi:dihydroorotate dehydrogenase (quinone), mitochondrial [Condylostylus longicornis]|uniref:dihydroorotate dehydrogenase (quinone), mitochondrial n=1 Tax=Condylostylus longicornis TaxID=2530218 RepID=UPI00244DF707|nr:dihydroorotate dehydrogenase (quinone), mitochondrial [Condylostylus longicornis]